MDLETENRLATMLLKEAAELRREAEREGALAYLRRPNVRCRPNSRFLTSTVMGVEQANRALEVSEMWRARQKEIELDRKNECRSGASNAHKSDRGSRLDDLNKQHRDVHCSSTNRLNDNGSCEDSKGLRDEELEEFLHSRAKRGRGSIGSRVDETGPYLSRQPDSQDDCFLTSEHYRERQRRIALGPEKPTLLRCNESSVEDDDLRDDDERRKKRKLKEKKRHSKKSSNKKSSHEKKSSHRKRHKH